MKALVKLFSLFAVITVLFSCSMFGTEDDDGGSGESLPNTVTVRSMSSSTETFLTFEDATIDFWIEDQLGNTEAVAAPEVSNGGFSMTFLEWDSGSGQPTGNTWQGDEGTSYNLNGFINTEGNIHTQDSGEPGLRSVYPFTLNGSQIVIFEPTDFEVTSIVIELLDAEEKKGVPFVVGVFEAGDDPDFVPPIAGMEKTIPPSGEVIGYLHVTDSSGNDTGHYVYAPEGYYDVYYLIDEIENRQWDSGEYYYNEYNAQPDVSLTNNTYTLTFPGDFNL